MIHLCLAAFIFCLHIPGQTQTNANKPALQSDVELFMPMFISDGFSNRDLAISPDGKELFYTIMHRGGVYSCLMTSKKNGNQWSEPAIVSFSGHYNDLEPFFSNNGKRLYFSSNRPLADTGKRKDYDIWYVDKLDNGNWGKPVNMGAPINSSQNEFYPSVANNGNMYFTRVLQKETGEDIVVCEKTANGYLPPVRLPEAVNSNGDEFNAFVSPKEDYIIFSSADRKDELGGGDLYISFKKGGNWQTAAPMPAQINSKSLDYCPFVTADGEYFYFTSNRSVLSIPMATKPADIKKTLSSPQNGFDDIYRIPFKKILTHFGM